MAAQKAFTGLTSDDDEMHDSLSGSADEAEQSGSEQPSNSSEQQEEEDDAEQQQEQGSVQEEDEEASEAEDLDESSDPDLPDNGMEVGSSSGEESEEEEGMPELHG